MVPELEDLERKGLFSKQELRALVKKRTKFEYSLKRRRAAVGDFLRYVEYEANVNALRRERKRRLRPAAGSSGKKKSATTTVSDYSIDQRIISIFERAVVRHSEDKRLWIQFIAFVRGLGAGSSSSSGDDADAGGGYSRLLFRLYGRAIAAHPRDPKMWIMAADYQLSDMANGAAARALMQRALRVNPESRELWAEYLRLELLLVDKIRTRRRVLGIDGEAKKEEEEEEGDAGFIDLPELDEHEREESGKPDGGGSSIATVLAEIEERIETKALLKLDSESAELTDEQKAAMATAANPYLQGVVARIVYDQAVAAVPDDLEFRKELAAIVARFDGMESLHAHAVQTVSRDFANSPPAIAYLCTAGLLGVSLDSPALVDALQTAVAAFQENLERIAGNAAAGVGVDVPGVWAEYIRFLTHWHETCACAGSPSSQAMSSLASYFALLLRRACAAVCEDKDARMSSEVAVLLLDSNAVGDNGGDDGTVRWLEDATARFPLSVELWIRRMTALIKESNGANGDAQRRATDRVFETQALSVCAESQRLWSLWLDWTEELHGSGVVSDQEVQSRYRGAFIQTAKLPSECAGLKEELQTRFVGWAHRTGGLEAMRAAYGTVSRQAYPTLGFYKRCLELESDPKHLVVLHEYACRVRESDMEPWLAYLRHLVTQQRKLEDAASVFWRASRALATDDDRAVFDSRYQALLY
ncbi:U3 snoRNP protein [Coemansia sp. RSA 2049]|nr:U3 snoRNP protein [Coemansia sp. RSA 2049]